MTMGSSSWQPVESRAERFAANLEGLVSRDAALGGLLRGLRVKVEYHVRESASGKLEIGVQNSSGEIKLLANPVPPTTAKEVAKKLFPSGACTEPVLIAGLDQGWLWQAVYDLDCNTPAAPGHTPPLYFLASDVERLWLIMHLHDWSRLLPDARVRLFVGADAVNQLRASMISNLQVPWAKLCVTIDSSIWPAGVTVDSLWQEAHLAANERMQRLSRQIETFYAGLDVKTIAQRLQGDSIRVMGITSRFTTFLKHSMADWLEGFEALGHETRIVMEQADHEMTNPVYFAEEVMKFRPDLLVMIDHYRGEIAGLPKNIPFVMWVQDHLPNIFNPKAGAAQGPRDYCLGFGRLQLRNECGYPEERFLPAQVGINEKRFVPRVLSPGDSEQFACDVCFVSHASTPATTILTEQLNRADAGGRKLLLDVFEQLRAIYDAGSSVTQPLIIRQMIESAAMTNRLQLEANNLRHLTDLFNLRINNALFRHQAIKWVAELGVDLHLWGKGWEAHRQFSKFARGIACNHTQLSSIYQASRINLQLTPHGAVHQRLFEGLAAGGFFLLRYCPGDVVERVYRRLYDWCQSNGVANDNALKARLDQIRTLHDEARRLVGLDPFDTHYGLYEAVRLSADGGYIRSAATIWESEYEKVSFASAGELRQRIEHYLSNAEERSALASSMREKALARFTYSSTSRNLLRFVAEDLIRQASQGRSLAA